ncbi:MAG: aminotransferase class V-fold PLP-dependent enzyme [Bacteroidia bacterium]
MEKNSWPINLTTGPIFIPDDVKAVFGRTPVSHRSDDFVEAFKTLQQKVCLATGARHVVFMTGSGSLANEAMIAQIKRTSQKGLILSNGEFGNRLINQCQKQQVSFDVYRKEWGEEYLLAEIETVLKAGGISWMLFTHCESSTGCIADLKGLIELGRKYKVKICLDAMSTIGNIPLHLDGIFLATCSSGKGLASFAGIAIVFTSEEIEPDPFIPTYIDLGHYFKNNGIPFTISSNLIMALNRAVDYSLRPGQTENVEALSKMLLEAITRMPGISVVNKNFRLPTHITTIVPHDGISSVELGDEIKTQGVETSYNSGYLKVRNQLQIAIMGQHTQTDIKAFLDALEASMKKLAARKKATV